MTVNIHDILKMPSLHDAHLIAGKNQTEIDIQGVNVLEATDISNSGRPGEVIITSYFALQDLSESELSTFFEKLHTIGISAVIIKIDRLVRKIPAILIDLCDTYNIPLIQIGKEVKYESIILEILSPIVNKNVNLLHKYYEVHSELTRLALKMPSMDKILAEFKKMLQRDVSLVNVTKGNENTTNADLSKFSILGTQPLAEQKYIHYSYLRKHVRYTSIENQPEGQQLCVHVPHLGYDDYELTIHERNLPISSEDFMVLENGVKFLQMELLRNYVISQNLFQQKNNIIGDLLNDRVYEKKDMDDVLQSLQLNRFKNYQLLLITLYHQDENKAIENEEFAQRLRLIRLKIKSIFRNIIFLEKLDRIVFIYNFNDAQKGFHAKEIETIMDDIFSDPLYKGFCYHASISSKISKLNIPKAHREVLDTQKILRLFHNTNKIMPYEELGIYKLFLNSSSLGNLKNFISPKTLQFRKEYPLLFDTLKTFLDTNQSYHLTSEKLFLHPKTVRYRIDKIKNLLGIDLTNPEELLQIQIAARLFKLIDGRNGIDEQN